MTGFLKQVAIMETIKKDSVKIDENIDLFMDRIAENIRKRDKKNFYYKGQKKDIHVKDKFIIYKVKNKFHKIEIIKNNCIFLKEKNWMLWGKSKIAKYDDIKIKFCGRYLIFQMSIKNKKAERLINIKDEG